jgi:hypothetical protein
VFPFPLLALGLLNLGTRFFYGGKDVTPLVLLLLKLPDGVDMRCWVGARRGRCCMVAGGGDDMCARQLSGCRLVVLGTTCPWWPLFPSNPLLGVRNPRHQTGSNICVVVAPVPVPGLACDCHGPRGIFLMARGLASVVLVGYVVHLLLTTAVPSRVWLRWLCPGSAGLRRVLGLSLRLDLSLMELF